MLFSSPSWEQKKRTDGLWTWVRSYNNPEFKVAIGWYWHQAGRRPTPESGHHNNLAYSDRFERIRSAVSISWLAETRTRSRRCASPLGSCEVPLVRPAPSNVAS